jgi:hypothetical protein
LAASNNRDSCRPPKDIDSHFQSFSTHTAGDLKYVGFARNPKNQVRTRGKGRRLPSQMVPDGESWVKGMLSLRGIPKPILRD